MAKKRRPNREKDRSLSVRTRADLLKEPEYIKTIKRLIQEVMDNG